MNACREHGVPLVPFGAGTSLEGQVNALAGGVSVDLSQMSRILRISVEDLDATVEAGVTRLQLDRALRPEGVFFPVDPGADATIGGMVATGASGTTTVRYGAMRENVVSLTVVTAAGEVVRTRSRARKSSAGYDLTRLFIGSEGTLGVITEVTLRLHPTPEASLVAVCPFDSLSDAVACVVRTLQLGIPVARIELLDAAQLEAINRRHGTDYRSTPTLFLEFNGGEREVRDAGRAGRGDRAGARRERVRHRHRHGRAPAALGRPPPGLRGRARAQAGVARLRHRRLRPDLPAAGVHRGDTAGARRLRPPGAARRSRRRRELPSRDPDRPRQRR